MSLFSRFVVATLPVVPKFVVGKVASRYVAGETLADAIETVRSLNALGAMATVDILGEEVSQRDRAEKAVEEYLGLFDAIHRDKLDANVSIKPTMVGLKIDREFFEQNVVRLVERARDQDNFLRLDMEDRTCTDATLETYRRVHQKHSNLGVVLQAYMRRTLRDIEELPSEHANVRLCKGIYIEPRADAWKGYETVRRNFVGSLEKLFRQGVYVGIATHDEYLVCAAVELIDRLEVPRERYEFQMLLGVDHQLRDLLLAEGHRLRVYVPYGEDWYLYSMRRLRENPEVASHVIKATLSREGRSS